MACLSMRDDLKFKHSFTCILSRLSRSGKSSFGIWFMQKIDALCIERNFDGRVIWYVSEKTAVPSPMVLTKKNARFNEGVPAVIDNARGEPCLVNLDNMLNDFYSKQVCDLLRKAYLKEILA